MKAHVRTLTRKVRCFRADDSGPTTVEYGVLVALIAVALLAAAGALGISVADVYATVTQSVG